MAGLTLDSGALIAFERQDQLMLAQLKTALLDGVEVTVPSVVVAEVWRGGSRSARVARLLACSVVDEVDDALARAAGEALGRAGRSDTVDAIVMASAARRGDVVLTSDEDDLGRLRAHFPRVRVVGV